MAPIMLGKHRKAEAPVQPDLAPQQFADPIQQQLAVQQQQTAGVQQDQQQVAADPVQATVQTRTQLNGGIPPAVDPTAPPVELTEAQKMELAQISNKKHREKRAEEMREENRQRILAQRQRVQERQKKDVSAEEYQAERLSAISNIPDICEQINQLTIDQDKKKMMIHHLQLTHAMLQTMTAHITRTIPGDQASFEILLHMLNYCTRNINQNSNAAYCELDKMGAADTIPKDTAERLKIFLVRSAFIDNVTRKNFSDVAWQAFYDGEQVTWGALLKRAGQDQVIDITGQKTGRMGQAMSAVTTIGTGEDTQFFKEDEFIQGEKEIIRDAKEEIKGGLATEEERQSVDRFCYAHGDQISQMDRVLELLRNAGDGQGKLDLNNADLLKLLNESGAMAKVDASYLSNETAAKIMKAVLRRRMAAGIGANLGLEEGQGLSERNVATVRMASILGMKEQVVHSQQVKLVQDGASRSGFVMNKAKGLDYTHLHKAAPPGHDEYTGEFQRQLMNLQLLDNICGQFDRHLNNVFFDYAKEGKKVRIRGITGIDNDMAFGTKYITHGTQIHMRSCMDKDGNYIFPVVDRDFYEHLMTISEDTIEGELEMIKDPKYIRALLYRLNRVRDGITKALTSDPPTCRLVDKDGWGKGTLMELCKGETWENNRSYLSRFVAGRRECAGQRPL